MEPTTTLSFRKFNDSVRKMNQSNAKQLVLTAQEARSLHADIFTMLTTLADSVVEAPAADPIVINLDGGSFSQ